VTFRRWVKLKAETVRQTSRTTDSMINTILEIVLAGAAVVAACAVGATCLLGFAVWLGGTRERTVK
jgi:hypothetical protein